jgi:hypothetical protein
MGIPDENEKAQLESNNPKTIQKVMGTTGELDMIIKV